MENMEYYTQRLQCSDEEKDACLETAAKVYHVYMCMKRDGGLAPEMLAKEEKDPFFRACLLDLVELWGDSEGLERLYSRYLMAENLWGGAFLNAVIITKGLGILARLGTEQGGPVWGLKDSYEIFAEVLRGYFGVRYREKVIAVLKQEFQRGKPMREYKSLLPEFDKLTELSPEQRDWLVRNTSTRTLRLALRVGGIQVSEFLMKGMDDREQFEKDLDMTTNARMKDVERAQREMLERAEEVKTCI